MFSFIAMKPRTSFFLFVTLALTLGASASAADALRNFDQRCWSAVPLDLEPAPTVLVDGLSVSNVFQVEIPSPGLLLTEVSENLGSLKPSIELISEDCRPLRAQDVTYVERFPGRSAVKVNTPGIYHLRVTTDPEIGEGRYRLRVGFSKAIPFRVNGSAAKEVEEWEEDDEGLIGFPKPVSLQLSDSAAKEVEEWEEDDEGLTVAKPMPSVESAKGFGEGLLAIDEPGILEIDATGADLTAFLEPLDAVDAATTGGGTSFGPAQEILTRIDPGTYSLRWAVPEEVKGFSGPRVSFYPVCGPANADDHGDTLACSSEIGLGSEVSGEIRSDPATDVDLFSFVLASHARVVLETSGETDTYLSLLDATGRPLTADDDGGAGTSSRIEVELCPGRYFLRVAGVGDSEGHYVLRTSTDPS